MLFKRILSLSLVLLLVSSNAHAEGFSMQEWSARGLSLAGGLVARADDASAVAYNPAGITQLPGTPLMGGLSLISPYGYAETRENGRTTNTDATRLTWFPPHAYATRQLNDDWWLGVGVFSRFGLGNQYPENWPGRYNIYNVGLQTLSVNPVLAYKVNNHLSLAAGVELMRLDIYMEKKVSPMAEGQLFERKENDMRLEGESWGVGMNAAAHVRFNDQWSAGLTYRSQVQHSVGGRVKFAKQYNAEEHFGGAVRLPELKDSDATAKVLLPDSAAFAVMWKPTPKWSFEAGTIWTRWSTYEELNIYPERAPHSLNRKAWSDGWNYNISMEYKPLDWLALRLGYWYETPVVNERYADYMVPSYGRDGAMVGAGFTFGAWTVDVAYAHLWIHTVDYDASAARDKAETRPGLRPGILPGASRNSHTDMLSLSIGYKF
jgi:long-chain fatty acid transport protein